MLLARDMTELERARAELDARGRRRGDDAALRRAPPRRRARRGRRDRSTRWRTIDVLINNAGVIQVGPLDHMSREDFENAMATHFWGPLHLILETVPVMRHRGFGRIVNIASIGGAHRRAAPRAVLREQVRARRPVGRASAPSSIRTASASRPSPGLMRTGSPLNADFKGQHDEEYAWFKISSSIPGLTIAAERAARQILEACRYGDPALTITPAAKVAAVANVGDAGDRRPRDDAGDADAAGADRDRPATS